MQISELCFGTLKRYLFCLFYGFCQKRRIHALEAHKGVVTALSFSPFSEYLFVSGSSDKSVALWDTRRLVTKLHSFEAHTEGITSVEWSPFSDTVFASSARDKIVCLWDLRRIGEEQSIDIIEDGPTEMIFVHAGHTAPVLKIVWNNDEHWTCASIAENGVLQFWKVRNRAVADCSKEFTIDPDDLE